MAIEQAIDQQKQDDNTPSVVSYRVGQLEVTVKEGFAAINQKLEQMQHEFALRSDLVALEKKATGEHQRLENSIAEVDAEVKNLIKFKDSIVNRIAVGAIFMFVAMVFALYGLDKFIR